MIHCRNYMASRSSRNSNWILGMWRILRVHVVWQSLPPPLSRPHDVLSRFRVRTNPVHALVPLTRNHGQQGFLQASILATKYRCPHMLHNSRAYHPRKHNLGFRQVPFCSPPRSSSVSRRSHFQMVSALPWRHDKSPLAPLLPYLHRPRNF